MSEPAVTEQISTTSPGEDEISLLDLLIVLAKHKWEILGATLIASAFAVAASVMQTAPIYTATVKILPPLKSQSTASAILAQLGGGGGGFGEFAGSSFLAMIKSDTVADKLIQRFQLLTRAENYPVL